MKTYAFDVEPWPCSLDIEDVERHKNQLLQKASNAQDAGEKLVARSIVRGALYWDHWLIEKAPGQQHRERVISSLELARDAGDWKEAELLLEDYARIPQFASDAFVETWRDTVRNQLPKQVENEQRLEIAFQQFRNAQNVNDDDARLKLAREITAQARAIGEIGSPVAVNNLLARVSAFVGWNEAAEHHYLGLVVCRPLWIPYIVQLSEHQAKADIKRAFQTLEAAKALLGKDFWLVT